MFCDSVEYIFILEKNKSICFLCFFPNIYRKFSVFLFTRSYLTLFIFLHFTLYSLIIFISWCILIAFIMFFLPVIMNCLFFFKELFVSYCFFQLYSMYSLIHLLLYLFNLYLGITGTLIYLSIPYCNISIPFLCFHSL